MFDQKYSFITLETNSYVIEVDLSQLILFDNKALCKQNFKAISGISACCFNAFIVFMQKLNILHIRASKSD